MIMYDKHLDTFIKAAQAGSFNKAAQELYLSPNAIMKQVSLLEERLGLTLFDRTPRGIKLTKAGAAIYQDALYLVEYANRAVGKARTLQGADDNLIKIGTSLTTPVNFLVKMWPRINKIAPHLSFELVSFENNPKNAVEIMSNLGEAIDLVAGIYNENLLKRRNCQALKIMDSPIQVALALNHPLAQKQELTLADLKEHKIMIIEPGYMNSFDQIRSYLSNVGCQIGDFPFYDISVFNQCEKEKTLLLAVNQWEAIHPLIKIIPVKWDFVIPYGIIYSQNPTAKITNFIKVLKKAYYD